jgi:starch synthase
MVSRLIEQKGLDLIAGVADELASLDASFTVIGTGEARYEEMWHALSASHPLRIAVFVGFDEERAHLIEAGADLFLMPSRFEPCGLNQMYSLRRRPGRHGPRRRIGRRTPAQGGQRVRVP